MTHIVVNMDTALNNSYKNYHTKGLHYLCLKRSEKLTEKLYFISQEAACRHLVVLHDHRYDFYSRVLVGRCMNILFEEGSDGIKYNEFVYDTPLNKGAGFLRKGETSLAVESMDDYQPGEYWTQLAEEIHTIQCDRNTILYQRQYEDRIVGPTRAFSEKNELPSLAGLYQPMTEDDIYLSVRKLVSIGFPVEIIG